MNSRCARSFIAMSIAALLAGCAALRVDVDVYKGPLTNHKDIQTSQFAALAIAAKPLLIQVRNNLELSGLPEAEAKVARERIVNDYVAQGTPNAYRFRREGASLINAVLSLYKPYGTAAVRPTVKGMSAALEQYEDALSELRAGYRGGLTPERLRASFRPSLVGDDRPIFHRINQEFDKFKENYIHVIFPTNDTSQRDAREALQSACKQLTDAVRRADAYEFRPPEKRAPRLPDIAGLCVNEENGNAFYESALNADFLDTQRRVLFVQAHSPEAMAFGESLKRLAAAYRKTRAALDSIWKLSIAEILALSDTADSEAIAALAEITSNLTQTRHLACLLSEDGFKTRVPQSEAQFIRNRDRSAANQGFHQGGDWGTPRYQYTTTLLTQAMAADPKRIASWLSAAHEAFKDAPPADLPGCHGAGVESLVPRSARSHGLVRGPLLQAGTGSEFSQLLLKLQHLVARVAAGSALGLERGRPQAGLEDLTEDYIAAMDRPASKRDQAAVEAVRARLIEALLSFAEKMTFLANNQAVLSLTNNNDRSQVAAFATLQAVGNSITIYADELRNREEHDRKIGDRARSERLAAEQSFRVGASRAYDDLLSTLRAQIADAISKLASLSAAQPGRDGALGGLDSKLALARTELAKHEASAEEASKALASASTKGASLIHTYRTLDGTAEPLPGQERLESPAALQSDAAGLRAALIAPSNDLAGPGLRDEAVQWLMSRRNQYSTATLADPRVIRLSGATEYLIAATSQIEKISASPRSSTYDQIRVIVRQDYEGLRRLLTEYAQTLKSTVAKRDEVKRQVADWEKDRTDIAAKSTSTTSSVTAAQQRQDDLEGASVALSALKETVLRKATEKGLGGDPNAIYGLIRLEVLEQRQKETDASKVRNLARAEKVLADLAPTLGARRLGLPYQNASPNETQKDVIDNVVAVLRYDLIEARAAGATPKAEAIERAIKEAYEQRGGMAYLRPASTFLRSVYTASALQPHESYIGGWNNLLTAQTMRSVPILGELMAGKSTRLSSDQLRDLDAQFWQNINTVQFSGAGNANYVIAKDDIGNWYAKAYQSDPTPIYRAAKSMLLFNTGGKLDVNLLRRDELETRLRDKTLSPEVQADARTELKGLTVQGGRAGSSAFSKVQQVFRTSYDNKTKDDHQRLRDLIDNDSLLRDIDKRWDQDLQGDDKGTQVTALKIRTASRPVDLAAARSLLTDTTDSDKRADEVLAAMKQIRRFRNNLVQDILRSTLPSGVEDDKRNLEADALAKRQALADAQKKSAADQAAVERFDAVAKAVRTAGGDTAAADKDLATAQGQAATSAAQVTAAQQASDRATSASTTATNRAELASRNRGAAALAVHRATQDLLVGLVERRTKAVQDLETAISVVGEASR